MLLAWFRKHEDIAVLGAAFGISRATSDRYHHDGITALAAQAPDLHEALYRAHEEGLTHLILGREGLRRRPLRREDHQSERRADRRVVFRQSPQSRWQRPSRLGANRICRRGFSDVGPASVHDLVAAARDHVLPALYWAAAHLDLPTLAERGYEGAGIGIHTPIKQPADGRALAPRETAPTTRCSVGCAPCASAASPCSSARWRVRLISRAAPKESAPSSKPHSFSPTSNTGASAESW